MNRRAFIRNTSLVAAGLMLRGTGRAATLLTGAQPSGKSDLLEGLGDAGDLRLPAWGPYGKECAGISHLPDVGRGLRFDLSVFPGLYRRRQTVPLVTSDTGFYAWSASPDLRTYTLRHVLEGLETFFVDITYTLRESGVSVCSRFVNRTSLPQQASLHLLASLHFPESGPYRQPPLRPAEVGLPPGAAWIDGSRYSRLELDEGSPRRHLPDNSEIWGEVRGDGFVHGTGLGQRFGREAGNAVAYSLPAGFAAAGTVALLRYRLAAGASAMVHVSGSYRGAARLDGTGRFEVAAFSPGDTGAGDFRLEASTDADLELNGFALVRPEDRAQVSFAVPELDTRPALSRRGETALSLRYGTVPGSYGLQWADGPAEVREWLTDRIDHDFPLYTHEHVKRRFELGGSQHYTNVFIRPVFLAPGEERTLWADACHGPNDAGVAASLQELASKPRRTPTVDGLPPHTDAGRAYAYGVERLAATLATNVVYPVRRRGRFVRHYTPGRWWDSLYTWDSGFIGLGLLELEPARSVDNLAAYLTRADDDCAFIHHGSPVPVQIYQLQAVWQRTRDRAVLARLFPGARRMHRFLAGRAEGSRTRTLASGLIRTWDYFYNSGGWDDYPPQQFIRGTKLTASVTPVVNSAHAIRTAKVLRELAAVLGEPTGEFEADIASLGDALQRHAWNPAEGWFSYVMHDGDGHPVGPLRHESGTDFNRGLDGIYPLVAGICTPEQEALFLGRLRDERVFWTRCGLSTVDQGAPYFREDGYWNGAVWMAHQWFIWKTLLDLGEADLAWRVAGTALEVWEREVRATGCSFEHFIIRTGRGAGWHQFGGLSAPVLAWFAAYFRPGALTGGFDCWILDQESRDGGLSARLRLAGNPAKAPAVVAVLPGRGSVFARWNGSAVPAHRRHAGTWEIVLPGGAGEGVLELG